MTTYDTLKAQFAPHWSNSTLDAVLESIAYAIDHDDTSAVIGDIIHECVDSSLVYTSDIVDRWIKAGHPDSELLDGSQSITEQITYAVYEHETADIADTLGHPDTVQDLLDDLDATFVVFDPATGNTSEQLRFPSLWDAEEWIDNARGNESWDIRLETT